MSSAADYGMAALDLLELGRRMAEGKVSGPLEAARALSKVAVVLAPVDTMKAWLDEDAAAQVKVAAELEAEAKIGPRP